MRKCFSVADPDLYTSSPAPHSGYVPEGTHWQGLLWREIRQIERSSKMDDRQRCIFELMLWGCTTGEIATGLNLSVSTVKYHRRRALAKAARVPHCGLFTVLVEEVGWAQMRVYLSELIDSSLPDHPLAARIVGKRRGA